MSVTKRKGDILQPTRDALKSWAYLSHSQLPNWPKASIMASVMTGRGTGEGYDIPAQAKEVERVVNELYVSDRPARDMILLHYLANGEIRQKVRYLGVSSKTYYEKLYDAEYAVKVGLGW